MEENELSAAVNNSGFTGGSTMPVDSAYVTGAGQLGRPQAVPVPAAPTTVGLPAYGWNAAATATTTTHVHMPSTGSLLAGVRQHMMGPRQPSPGLGSAGRVHTPAGPAPTAAATATAAAAGVSTAPAPGPSYTSPGVAGSTPWPPQHGFGAGFPGPSVSHFGSQFTVSTIQFLTRTLDYLISKGIPSKLTGIQESDHYNYIYFLDTRYISLGFFSCY